MRQKLKIINKYFPIIVTVLLLTGCASRSISFLPSPNQHRAELTAEDIVKIMRRAGFEDEEIVEKGTALRNALATHGACQVSIDEFTDTIFAVHNETIYIVGYRRGSSIYNLKKKSF